MKRKKPLKNQTGAGTKRLTGIKLLKPKIKRENGFSAATNPDAQNIQIPRVKRKPKVIFKITKDKSVRYYDSDTVLVEGTFHLNFTMPVFFYEPAETCNAPVPKEIKKSISKFLNNIRLVYSANPEK